MDKEFKSFEVEVKVDEDKREIEAYASIFDYVDAGDDRVRPGAFTETLRQDRQRKNSRIKALWQHDPRSPVGRPKHIEEDSTGLYTVTPISKTTLGNDLIILAKDEVINETSIGYTTEKFLWNEDEGVRDLVKLNLWEYSFVTWGMNDQAAITGVKSLNQLKNYIDVIYETQKEIKAGRVLSESNRQLVMKARDALQALLDVSTRENTEKGTEGMDEVKELAESILVESRLREINKNLS